VILSRPGRSGEDEPGFEAIGSCVHKRRALNTRLSSGTPVGTCACPAGPYRNCRGEAGTKHEPKWYFVPVQKKGPKVDPHVSNLKSRFFSRSSDPPLIKRQLSSVFIKRQQHIFKFLYITQLSYNKLKMFTQLQSFRDQNAQGPTLA